MKEPVSSINLHGPDEGSITPNQLYLVAARGQSSARNHELHMVGAVATEEFSFEFFKFRHNENFAITHIEVSRT